MQIREMYCTGNTKDLFKVGYFTTWLGCSGHVGPNSSISAAWGSGLVHLALAKEDKNELELKGKIEEGASKQQKET